MEAIQQVYERMPEVITIPDEIRDRHVRVTFEPLDEVPDLAALAASIGMKLEDVKDLHALRFLGKFPDFPPREPQGEYESREEIPWK